MRETTPMKIDISKNSETVVIDKHFVLTNSTIALSNCMVEIKEWIKMENTTIILENCQIINAFDKSLFATWIDNSNLTLKNCKIRSGKRSRLIDAPSGSTILIAGCDVEFYKDSRFIFTFSTNLTITDCRFYRASDYFDDGESTRALLLQVYGWQLKNSSFDGVPGMMLSSPINCRFENCGWLHIGFCTPKYLAKDCFFKNCDIQLDSDPIYAEYSEINNCTFEGEVSPIFFSNTIVSECVFSKLRYNKRTLKYYIESKNRAMICLDDARIRGCRFENTDLPLDDYLLQLIGKSKVTGTLHNVITTRKSGNLVRICKRKKHYSKVKLRQV